MERLKKKCGEYGLDFDALVREFDLASIDLEKMDFLNSFVRIIISKARRFGDYAAPFFIPGGFYSGIIIGYVKEKGTIDEAKNVYKEVMVWYHEALKVETGSEKEQVKFIKDFLKDYEGLKKRVIFLLDVCKGVFKNLEEKKEEKGYLG